MDKKEAKKVLAEEGRFSISPEYAEEICKAFGLELDKALVRTTLGYREEVKDPKKPRVDVCYLARYIATKLNVEKDQETYHTACMMSGEGSHRDLLSQAYAKNL